MRRAPLAASLGVICFLLLGASSCTGKDTSIGVGRASRGDVSELVDASASVTARAVATLTAPTAGTVRTLTVTAGARVSAGQVVAVIDSPQADAQLREARSALDAAGGGGFSAGGNRADLLAVARRTDTAAAKAFATARQAAVAVPDPTVRAALLAQVDAAAAQYASVSATARDLVESVQKGIASVSKAVGALGAAQRAQAQSAYDLARAGVDALTLKAPIAGLVQLGGAAAASSSASSLSDLLSAAGGAAATSTGAGSGSAATGPGVDDAVSVGAQVGAGSPIATIVDTSSLGLIADVDETDILLVAPGVRARVELDAAPGAGYDATVRSVDLLPTASARGGVAYRVRLTLGSGTTADGQAAPTPRPGMSAVAHLNVRQAHGVVTVPAAAVFTAPDGRDAVWRVRDGRAVQTPVTVGVQGQDQVQIVAGLSLGDTLVVRGTDHVHAGQSL